MKKVREGYKMTEIGEIPEDWEVKSIKEVADVVSGGTPSKNVNEYWEGGYIAWATPTDITKNRGKYIEETELYITESGLKNSSANLLPIGSILMCSRATIGPRCINTVPMATNQGFKSFVCKDNLFNEFMYYLLEIVKDEFISLASGSTFLEISKREVENKLIPVPPLVEQKKIAEILSTVDESIKKTDEIIEKTKELKKGLMQKLLTKGIGHSKFKMTEIGEIPEEWEVKSLQAVSELITRGKGPKYVDRSPYIVINQKCIRWEGLDLNFVKYMDENAWFELNDKYKLKYMDVVINSTGTGTLGRATIFREKNNKFMADSHVTIIRTKSEELDPTYLMYYLQTDKCQNDIYSYCISGSTNQIELAKSKFETLNVPIPPLQEQRQIASILSAVDEKIEAEEKRKEQLLQLKKGLMQQLLTGRVRIK